MMTPMSRSRTAEDYIQSPQQSYRHHADRSMRRLACVLRHGRGCGSVSNLTIHSPAHILPPAQDLAFGKELKRVRWIGLRIAVVALCLVCSHAFGQAQGPSDTLAISGDNATNWID